MKLTKVKGTFLSAALCMAVGAAAVYGQETRRPQELKLYEPLEGELESGQTHEYQLTLKAGEFVQVRAEQKGIDIVLSIHSSDGKELSKVNSPNEKEGFEILSLIADSAGVYVVKISSPKETGVAERGAYGIALIAKRPSAAQDIKRIEAERQLFNLFQARSKTVEERRAEVEKYDALYPVWREFNDDYILSLIENRICALRRKAESSQQQQSTNGSASINIAGKWNMLAEADRQSMPISIELKQEGENITGTFSSHVGSGTVPSGKVIGNTITAIVRIVVQGQTTDLQLKGKIDGDKMSGTVTGPMIPLITFTATKAN